MGLCSTRFNDTSHNCITALAQHHRQRERNGPSDQTCGETSSGQSHAQHVVRARGWPCTLPRNLPNTCNVGFRRAGGTQKSLLGGLDSHLMFAFIAATLAHCCLYGFAVSEKIWECFG